MTLTLPVLLDRLADEEAKRIREAQKNAHPGQSDCDICGLVGAGCFGFGASRTSRGVWACQDADCRAEAEARPLGTTTTLIAAE